MMEIQVDRSLIVSGAALMLTLAVLLVAVPLNGWVMGKAVAVVLMGLWGLSTTVNVVLEIMGHGTR